MSSEIGRISCQDLPGPWGVGFLGVRVTRWKGPNELTYESQKIGDYRKLGCDALRYVHKIGVYRKFGVDLRQRDCTENWGAMRFVMF